MSHFNMTSHQMSVCFHFTNSVPDEMWVGTQEKVPSFRFLFRLQIQGQKATFPSVPVFHHGGHQKVSKRKENGSYVRIRLHTT